jgi:hypothetical protein
MMALLTLAAAGCGGQEAGSSASTEGSGGSGGGSSAQGNTSSASSGNAVASSSGNAVASSSGAGGGSSFVCDPPAAPGSIYERSAVSYDINAIDPVSMCKYRGDVMLVVNTAAL